MQQLDYYANLLTLRKIDRREFMGRALALGVTTALATTMASTAIQAAAKRKGGTVRYANPLHGPDDQMDPIVFTSGIVADDPPPVGLSAYPVAGSTRRCFL